MIVKVNDIDVEIDGGLMALFIEWNLAMHANRNNPSVDVTRRMLAANMLLTDRLEARLSEELAREPEIKTIRRIDHT